MDLGLALPHFGKHASTEAIVRVAQEAEQMGLASLWVLERILRPTDPLPDPQRPGFRMPEAYANVFEPIETLTYVAAKTSRIKLGTSVIDALFHVPAVIGRRLATLDQLSGGRVIAGLGQGYMIEEFVAANVPRSRRGRGLEEFIAALRAVWAPDPVSFSGRFYKIPSGQISPKPLQPGGPKIIIGAQAQAAVERAGRIADGFNPGIRELAAFRETLARFEDAARASGRNPDDLLVVARANSSIATTNGPDTQFLQGTAEKIAADLEQLAGLHVDEVFFDFNQAGHAPEEQLGVMEHLMKAH